MPASDNLFLRYLRRLGAGSLLVSIIVHVGIGIVATLYVVSTVGEKREARFQGGGGSSGAPASAVHSVQMARQQPTLTNLTQRLAVDSPNAAVGLPDLPAMPRVAVGGGGPTAGSGFGAGEGLGVGAGTGKGPVMPAFGFRDARSGGSLAGRLYDLKQTPLHKPTAMDLPTYGQVVDSFLSRNWNTDVLNRFYQAPGSVYGTQLFIPLLPAVEGPKSFGQEKLVQPKFWLIRYKGRVAAPESGSWRFWGYGGEVCCVAINGKTVLVANHRDVKTPSVNWKSPEPPGQKAGSGYLLAGDWINLRADSFVDIDILIGERGGGTFDCFLLIEKKGGTYAKTKDGHPILPIFRLAPSQMQPAPDAPQIMANGPVWRALPPPKI